MTFISKESDDILLGVRVLVVWNWIDHTVFLVLDESHEVSSVTGSDVLTEDAIFDAEEKTHKIFSGNLISLLVDSWESGDEESSGKSWVDSHVDLSDLDCKVIRPVGE